MKKRLLLTVAVSFALATSAALVGCGSGDTGSADAPEAVEAESAAEEAQATPDANLFPYEIDSGHVVDNPYDESRTSDIWWKDGREGTEGIYLTDAANDAGKSVTWVDASGQDTESQFDCEVSADGHLVSIESAEPAIDIVFSDDLTCYDYASDTWYIRGDPDELMSLLAGLTFADAEGDWTVSFNPDGTFEDFLSNGDAATGSYRFVSSANVRLTYDDSGIDEETLDLEFDDGQVVALSNTWNHLDLQ